MNHSIIGIYIIGIITAFIAVVVIYVIFCVARHSTREKRGQSTCMKCKAAADRASQYRYLFLLPISFGDTYSDAENYLRNHMRPIMNKNQIPSGQRACWIDIFECSRCGTKQVDITDFLQVRGEEYAKAYHKFAYESFRPLIDAWTEVADQNFAR